MPTYKRLIIASFIFNVLKPYRWYVGMFLLIGLFWAMVNTALPYTLKLVIDKVVAYQGDKTRLLAAIQSNIFLYVSMWVALCVNMRLLDWVKLRLFPNVREDVMNHMFSYLGQHAYAYFQNNFAGSLISRITDMQAGIIEILSVIDDVYAQTVGLTIASLTLLWLHPIFAGILLAWVTSFLLIAFLFLKPIERLSHVFAQARSTTYGKMVDSISNILNVRLFARQDCENRIIQQAIAETVEKDRTMQKKIIVMRLLWDLSIVLLLGGNLWMLGNMYGQNLVSIGDFSFVMTLSISILWNLWFIAGQFVSFSEQVGTCKQALSILRVEHEIVDARDAKPLEIKQGEIKFNQVSFHYAEGTKLFQNKSVCIHPGEKVGLVGFSGSGKSSFVNLILRLFDVESGSITIDNQDIRHVTQDSLRENIALIPQDVSLFHRTLMDNIRYGQIDATDAEVVAASKQAHCHEFITTLQMGYQSLVGERGVKLSGGQRQRIAIARAILKNAPILILDEATSALDSVTERYIQDALRQLMQGKTTIVIAHRLSTLAEMDRILVFDHGSIIEDGTHESLLQHPGHYTRMWQMQAGGFLPKFA